MRKMAAFTATVCLLTRCISAGEVPEKLRFKEAGFSIAPLEERSKGPVQVLMMFLPASEGFAPNVNVQIQPFADGVDAYASLSRAQFKNAGLKVLSEKKRDGASVTFEYGGSLQGKSLHWYARAVK